MYDKTDLRSKLAPATTSKPVGSNLFEPSYGLFYQETPAEDDANGRTFYVRGQNFIIAYSEAKPGATFARSGQPDEFMVLLQDPDTPVIATAGTQTEQADGYALIIMPPGDSKLTFPNGGRVVRIFTTRSEDLAAKCSNAETYATPDANIPPLENWPDPIGGFKIRVYSLDVTLEPGRFGRIWRSTNMMVNIPNAHTTPRDITKVSPHHHDDFEQCSLALSGLWQHHMRWPWSIDMNGWHDDVHAEVKSPSVTVIPAQVIHTSTWHSTDSNQLVDIFSPPRLDFSRQEDWVLNEDEYPMPKQLADA